jgi:hypothetical protein
MADPRRQRRPDGYLQPAAMHRQLVEMAWMAWSMVG